MQSDQNKHTSYNYQNIIFFMHYLERYSNFVPIKKRSITAPPPPCRQKEDDQVDTRISSLT